MHELSLAIELVELAQREAHRLGAARIVSLHLQIGPLAGVVEEALLFSFDVAAEGTLLAGARIHIERDPVVAWCAACAQPRTLADITDRRCPECRAATPQLLSGDRFELTALEIEDHANADC